MVTLAAVALTAVMGGQRYLYCRAMDQIMADASCPCAEASVAASADERTSVRNLNDCFEVRFLGRLVPFTVTSETVVFPAALVGVLPPALPVPLPAVSMVAWVDHPIRAGPYLPSASRAQLMVFLI